MNTQNAPRLPTEEEREQLFDYLHTLHYFDGEDDMVTQIQDAAEEAQIAVFDHYSTDNTGYTGKIMFVAWPYDIAQYEMYIWNERGIDLVEQKP